MGNAQYNCNEGGSFSKDKIVHAGVSYHVLTYVCTKQPLEDSKYTPLFPIRWSAPAWVVCWLQVNVNDAEDPDKHTGVASCEPITS
jgi:hypothetical protein